MARAEETGRSWGPYGFDGRFFAAVTSYVRGRWDDTLALVLDVDPSVPTELSATLDAVGLLVTAARGETPSPARSSACAGSGTATSRSRFTAAPP